MKPNNQRLKLGAALEKEAKKSKRGVWKDVSEGVLASRKNRASVNIAEISRNCADGSSVIVPGKVLGAGRLEHKVTVAALSFSQSAKAKITSSGGKCMNIAEFVKSSTKTKNVRILG